MKDMLRGASVGLQAVVIARIAWEALDPASGVAAGLVWVAAFALRDLP